MQWHDWTPLLLGLFMLIATISIAWSTFVTASATRETSEATNRAVQAQLFSQLIDYYSSSSMATSLRILRRWKEDKGENHSSQYIEGLKTGNGDAYLVDLARRHVKFYFLKSIQLLEMNFVTKEFLAHAAAFSGRGIVFDVIKPLETALNPDTDISWIATLEKIAPPKEEEIVSVRIPEALVSHIKQAGYQEL